MGSNTSTSGIWKTIKSYRPYHDKRDLIHAFFPGLVYLLVTVYYLSMINAYLDRVYYEYMKEGIYQVRLKDYLVDYFYPRYIAAGVPWDLSDVFARICFACIVIFVLLGGKDTCWRFRRIGYLVGSMYFMRSFFVLTTHLPSALESCHPNPQYPFMYDALMIMIQARASCGDIFFSGHTIIFTTVFCCAISYPVLPKYKIVSTIVTWLLVIFTLGGMFSLITSAYHYTIDVMAGFMLTNMVWWLYYMLVEFPQFRHTWYGKVYIWYDRKPKSHELSRHLESLPTSMRDVEHTNIPHDPLTPQMSEVSAK